MPSPPPPLRRDQDIVAAAEVAAESRTLAPASTYRRREPAFANVEVLAASDRAALELRWRQPEEAAPAIHLHRIGPCRVTFPGVVRLADGRVVAESLHNLPEPRRQAMLAEPPRPHPPHGAEAAPPGETPLLLARAGSGNYGHWLVEHLGALLMLRRRWPGMAPISSPGGVPRGAPRLLVHAVAGEGMRRVLADSAALAGLGAESLLPLRRQALDLPSLLVLTPGSTHPTMKHPAVIAALARLAPAIPAGPPLFIRRTSTTKRVLHNIEAVEAAAHRLGFVTIEPGRMTLAEQIAAFAGARVVAGVSGADLTNIAFMPPRGQVVCLLPATGRNFFFWDLCCLRRHRYWSVFGPPLTDRGGGHDDFTVDVALAARVMERALEQDRRTHAAVTPP